MPEVPPPRAPAHVQPYVDAFGHDLAVKFLLTFGGSRLYWAQDPKGRSEAEALVGADRLRALTSARPREVSRVPTARTWLAHALRAKGLPVNQIARTLHVSDVAVGKYLRQAPDSSSGKPPSPPEDDQQLSLF